MGKSTENENTECPCSNFYKNKNKTHFVDDEVSDTFCDRSINGVC